jgi:hypothetical protein
VLLFSSPCANHFLCVARIKTIEKKKGIEPNKKFKNFEIKNLKKNIYKLKRNESKDTPTKCVLCL